MNITLLFIKSDPLAISDNLGFTSLQRQLCRYCNLCFWCRELVFTNINKKEAVESLSKYLSRLMTVRPGSQTNSSTTQLWRFVSADGWALLCLFSPNTKQFLSVVFSYPHIVKVCQGGAQTRLRLNFFLDFSVLCHAYGWIVLSAFLISNTAHFLSCCFYITFISSAPASYPDFTKSSGEIPAAHILLNASAILWCWTLL